MVNYFAPIKIGADPYEFFKKYYPVLDIAKTTGTVKLIFFGSKTFLKGEGLYVTLQGSGNYLFGDYLNKTSLISNSNITILNPFSTSYPITNAYDRNIDTFACPQDSMPPSTTREMAKWDLGSVQTKFIFIYYTNTGTGVLTDPYRINRVITVSISNDDSTYTTILDSPASDSPISFFGLYTFRYLKLAFKNTDIEVTMYNTDYHLREIQVFSPDGTLPAYVSYLAGADETKQFILGHDGSTSITYWMYRNTLVT